MHTESPRIWPRPNWQDFRSIGAPLLCWPLYAVYSCFKKLSTVCSLRILSDTRSKAKQMNSSAHYYRTAEIIYFTTNSISTLVCLVAAYMVFRLRLYRKVVYRLSLYQVLASLLLAVMSILATIISINYTKDPPTYGSVCTAIGWFIVYAQWAKLLFTAWVTFHLFCLVVLLKNLQRLEVLYVVTSLLVPAVVAIAPALTNTYSPTGNCYISAQNDSDHVALIENLVLWDGPALLVLLVAFVAMVVMVIQLSCRARCRLEYKRISADDTFWKALKQILPLAVFPILFCVFIIPVLVFDIYVAVVPNPNPSLELTVLVCIPMWSLTSGVTLLALIAVARCRARLQMRVLHVQLHDLVRRTPFHHE